MAMENLDDVYTYTLSILDKQTLISIKEYSLANIALLYLYAFKPNEQIAEKIANNYKKILDIIHENRIKLDEDPFVKEILPIFLWGFNEYCTIFKSDLCHELFDIANLLSTSQRSEKKIKIIALSILTRLEQNEEKKNMLIEQAKQLLNTLNDASEKIIAHYWLYISSGDSIYLHEINSLQSDLKLSSLVIWQLCFYDKSVFKEEILTELPLITDDKLTFLTALSGCLLVLKDTDNKDLVDKFLNIINAIVEPSLATVGEQILRNESSLEKVKSKSHSEEQIHEDVAIQPIIESISTEKTSDNLQNELSLTQMPSATEETYGERLSIEIPIELSLIPRFDFEQSIVNSFLQRVLLYCFRTYLENMYFTFDSIECAMEKNLPELLNTCHMNILKMQYSFDNTISYNDVSILVYKDSDDNVLALSFCYSKMHLVIALLHITKSKQKTKLRISDICTCNKR